MEMKITLSWNYSWLPTQVGKTFRRKSLQADYIYICIGNSMIRSDIWHKYHEWYFKIVIRKFEAILKYHKWHLCQISRTDHAIICLYYYPRKVCNFNMQVFQIKLKYHCF